MIRQAIIRGRLDGLVCNVVPSDRMLASMNEEEWTVSSGPSQRPFRSSPTCHCILARMRKAETKLQRIVNTSQSRLMGSIGQGNYAAAKAAIALLTVQQAAEWGRYVTANAVAPDRTRMTEGIFYQQMMSKKELSMKSHQIM